VTQHDDETLPEDIAAEAPADPAEDAGEDAVARLEAELAEWKDRALRAAAEADNVKRRAEREMNDARAYAIQRFANDLLGVADSLQRALAAAPRDGEAASVVEGLELIDKALLTAFENNGLKKVDPEPGARFDPHLHDAMMEQPSDAVPPGSVVSTMQPGYELFGRVVRPARVVVAARVAAANPYTPEGGDAAGAALDKKA